MVEVGKAAEVRQDWQDGGLVIAFVLEERTDGVYVGTFTYELGGASRTFSERLRSDAPQSIEHELGDVTVRMTVTFGVARPGPKRA